MNISNKIANWNEVLLQADKKVKEVVDQSTGQIYFEVAEYKNDNSLACRAINKIKQKSGIDLRFSFLNISKVVYTTKHETNLEEFIKDYRFDINTENFAYTKVTVKEFDAIKRSNALDKVMARELPINLDALSHLHTAIPNATSSARTKVELSPRGKEWEQAFIKNAEVQLRKAYSESDVDKIMSNYKSQGLAQKKEASHDNSFSSMLDELNKGQSTEQREVIAIGGTGTLHNSVFAGDSSPIRNEPKVELDDFAKELVAEYSKPEHKNAVKVVKSKDLGRGR